MATTKILETNEESDALCSQCQTIFSREAGNLFPDWNTDGHLISIQSEPNSNCVLCSLLLHRLFNDLQSEAEHQRKVRYWLEDREGFLYGGSNVHFEAVIETKLGDQKPFLNLGVHSVDFNDDTPAGRWSSKNDGRTDSSQVAVLQLPQWNKDLPQSTSSPGSLQQAKAWISDCLENHAVCQSIIKGSEFLPRRLIHIDRQGEEPRLRLCDTSILSERVQYMTLSHCWGANSILKLEKIRYASFINNIPFASIPKVFQDAIYIAGHMEIDYLWIDSLCIIQDSTEDWIQESETMGQIYRYGVCNIASTGFPDGSNGLFVTRNPSYLNPTRIKIPNNISSDGRNITIKAGNYLLIDIDTWSQGVDTAPLNRRGWVLQERSLSVRTLHFGSRQLFWECVEAKGSEVFPVRLLRGMPRMDPKFFIRPDDRPDRVRENYQRDAWHRSKDGLTASPVRGMRQAHQIWRTVVEQYSNCALTFGDDKLVAIAGLAREISPSMDSAYFAGLWRRDLEHQLLWKCFSPQPEIRVDGIPTRGPSWSWTSVDGEIKMGTWNYSYYGGGDVKWLAKVAEVATQHTGPNTFGQCSSGTLTLSGNLGVMLLDDISHTEKESPTSNPNQEDQEDEDEDEDENEDISDHASCQKNHALLSWDTLELSQRFGDQGITCVSPYCDYFQTDRDPDPRDVFFMPIRSMDEDACGLDYEKPMLKGLLLLPTNEKRGEYRRIGLFEVAEQWGKAGDVEAWDKPPTSYHSQLYQKRDEKSQYTITVI